MSYITTLSAITPLGLNVFHNIIPIIKLHLGTFSRLLWSKYAALRLWGCFVGTPPPRYLRSEVKFQSKVQHVYLNVFEALRTATGLTFACEFIWCWRSAMFSGLSVFHPPSPSTPQVAGTSSLEVNQGVIRTLQSFEQYVTQCPIPGLPS